MSPLPRRPFRAGSLALLAGVVALASASASAAATTFAIESLYTTADGAVQYVVLHETQGRNGQNDLNGQTLTVQGGGTVRVLTLAADLPATATAGKRVLIASQTFAARSYVAPDYLMPDRFLPTDGGSLDWAGADVFAFGQLPVDGTNALLRSGALAVNRATNFAGDTAKVPPGPVTVVEYYAPSRDHYFLSPLAPDIRALDAGIIGGWVRTGYTFNAYQGPGATGTPLSPVCRFYIPPEHGNSHFFSASPTECSAIAAAVGVNPDYSGFVYETPRAFFVALPDTLTGACPANTIPVYRVWNARPDTNHRYTIEPAIRSLMVSRGGIAEGFGPDRVAMCAAGSDAASGFAYVASAASPLAPECTGSTGVVYPNAEVEPSLAVNPNNPNHLIGVWQQDRWSNGGANALATGVSIDGGRTWTTRYAPFSRCAGGNAGSGGNFQRASDPWVTIAPDGTAYQIAIAFSGQSLQPGSAGAVLVSRSTDGGFTWGNPVALIADDATTFSDKESVTADPYDSRYVYAVWDRLTSDDRGPTWFARTGNGGASWEPARVVYDPGLLMQTINNQIVVLPDGTLVLFFTRIDNRQSGAAAPELVVMRSPDRGVTWSAPIVVSSAQSVGTRDPEAGTEVRDASVLGSIAVGRNGQLAVAWQDARAGGPGHDGIAFARSLDGGLTWSVPRGINAVPSVPAFVPTVQLRDDGVIGVTYYDMRNNTAAPLTLPADYWLTQSGDGVHWAERHVAGPFNLATAPYAEGLFLGDYQALAAIGNTFVPFFVQTNPASPGNRTDVVVSFLAGGTTSIDVRAEVFTTARAPAGATFDGASPTSVRESVARMIARRYNLRSAASSDRQP